MGNRESHRVLQPEDIATPDFLVTDASDRCGRGSEATSAAAAEAKLLAMWRQRRPAKGAVGQVGSVFFFCFSFWGGEFLVFCVRGGSHFSFFFLSVFLGGEGLGDPGWSRFKSVHNDLLVCLSF